MVTRARVLAPCSIVSLTGEAHCVACLQVGKQWEVVSRHTPYSSLPIPYFTLRIYSHRILGIQHAGAEAEQANASLIRIDIHSSGVFRAMVEENASDVISTQSAGSTNW